MKVLLKAQNEPFEVWKIASITMLKLIEEINKTKKIRCNHHNIGTTKHYLEINCIDLESFFQLSSSK